MQTKDIYINGEKTQYAINSDGTVIHTKTGRFLKGTVRRNEYLTYYLRHNGKQYNYLNSPMIMVSIVMYATILDIINSIYLETYQIAG